MSHTTEGRLRAGPLKRFRLVEISVRLRDWPAGFRWLWKVRRTHGLWPVLYGMDVWFNGVPLFRTILAAHVLVWVVLKIMG